MKTTIEIRDDLLKAAKKRAIDRGVPLRALVEEALEREVADGEEVESVVARRRELSERLGEARARFDEQVAMGRLPGESLEAARLRLLPLPTVSNGDDDLSLRVSEVLADSLRRRE
jgi:hypothetical protein